MGGDSDPFGGAQLGVSLLFSGQRTSEKNLLSFTASNGRLISLKRKRIESVKDVSWNSEESYGINVNELLDRIEWGGSGVTLERRKKNHKSTSKRLWTETWKPKSFLDLVGNERANRMILKWLRQWSPLVFGEKMGKAPADAKEMDRMQLEVSDPLGRPAKRILLISGPPGIGKTSVAHIVAQQAGYAVIEINASDERAGERVKDKVHNSLFNNTFDDRPVLLIADEIDGSTEGGLVKVLIDIVNKDYRVTRELIMLSSKQGKKRNLSDKLLTRPIVAICNNLYASSLEKLRPHCESVTLRKPSDSSLQERLEHVCAKERLLVDKKFLKELSESVQGDIRSCLNNLQFLNLGHGPSSSASSMQASETAKDRCVSWYKICNQVFRKGSHADSKTQMRALLSAAESNGSYQKIVQGCFTAYPSVKYSDFKVSKSGIIADWLFYHELMFKSLFEHEGELLRYNSITPLAFFSLFGDGANKEDIKIGSAEYDVREATRGNESILHRMYRSAPTECKVHSSRESFALEVLPLLDCLISVDVNRVSGTDTKRKIIENVANAVSAFGVEFRESKEPETNGEIILDPPFHQLTILDDKRSMEVKKRRVAIFNVIFGKLEEERIKKRAHDKISRITETDQERKKQKTSSSKPVDFFKSQYASVKNASSAEKHHTLTDGDEEAFRVWVRYKEGFSNAVRKTLTWNSLWE
ncbi:LAMI_0G03950g1_1 [Lachancea mirantina]|uniref:LAMI_0G03950g1_1 n=1 Tax=Lachancea mirantina TaxID=1230905 RepID=A0A1G4K8C6_9SACH|nr:LAMI_0G03950g1_1 [Lachancea mirantina]